MKPNSSSSMPLGIEVMHLFVCLFFFFLVIPFLLIIVPGSGIGVVTNMCMWIVERFDCALFCFVSFGFQKSSFHYGSKTGTTVFGLILCECIIRFYE